LIVVAMIVARGTQATGGDVRFAALLSVWG